MRAVDERLNNALDEALEMTFPASDPIAVYIAEPQSKIKNCRRTRPARRNPAYHLQRDASTSGPGVLQINR